MQKFFFILLIFPMLACSLQQEAANPTQTPSAVIDVTTSVITANTDDWELLVDPLERIQSIHYPTDYRYFQNQIPSVDGVVAQSPDTIAFQDTEDNFVVAITVKARTFKPTIEEEIAEDNACFAENTTQGSFPVWEGAVIYKNTSCGATGYITAIYLYDQVGAQLLYRVLIISREPYETIADEVETLLGTVVFRQNQSVP